MLHVQLCKLQARSGPHALSAPSSAVGGSSREANKINLYLPIAPRPEPFDFQRLRPTPAAELRSNLKGVRVSFFGILG